MKISNGVNYISSACLPFRETFNLLKYGSKNHLYNIELSSNLIHQEDYYSPLKQFQNFNFLIHNYFPAPKLPFVFNLASRNKNILEKSINHCKEAMDLCSFLRIPFYSVHSGFLHDPHPQDLGKKQTQYSYISRKMGLAIFKESIKKVLTYGMAKGVNLLIENNLVEEGNLIDKKNKLFLMVETNEILKFLSSFNNCHLGLLVDVGHLKVSANSLKFDPGNFFKKLKGYIKAFHLSDNNGQFDQNLPFNKNTWFMPILQKKEFRDLQKVLEFNQDVSLKEILRCLNLINSL